MEDDVDGCNELETAFVVETTCNHCAAEFLDSEDLELHLQQMHQSIITPNICQLCPATYTDLESYATHVIDKHLKVLQCCRYCTKSFTNEAKLKQHEENHVSNCLFACSLCDYMFPDATLLRCHEEKNHNNNFDGVFLLCMPHIAAKLRLAIVPLLQSIGQKTYICKVCSFKSLNFSKYLNHLKKTECLVVVCNYCCAVYNKKRILAKHIKKCGCMNEYMDKAVDCPECRKPVHPKNFRQHLKTCNTFSCVQCKLVCSSMDQLSLHQIKEHVQEIDIIRCRFCSKEFIGTPPLKRHIKRVHKPHFHLYKYKCITCNTIFPHPKKLFAHYFIHHRDLEPFHCKICNKKFRMRKGFTLHIKIDHKSVGFIEFDKQYHVFFAENKSENPFVPTTVIPSDELKDFESEDDDATSVSSDNTQVETEDEKKKKSKKQVKQKNARRQTLKKSLVVYSSDDEPLIEVRKTAMKTRRRKLIKSMSNPRRNWTWKKKMGSKNLYTCKLCHENCYTFQNYQNHMNTHTNSMIKCVKCSQEFEKTSDLTKHITEKHSSSKLTETLKNLLKKKQATEPDTKKTPDKFKVKMHKVVYEKSNVSAKIKPVQETLSVKNFLENFIPDVTEEKNRPKIDSDSSITIKYFEKSLHRESTIKMTKFKKIMTTNPVGLKMPERFKPDDTMKIKINIKMVQTATKEIINKQCTMKDNSIDYEMPALNDDHFHYYDDSNKIPEVAEEVSLEGTEEPQQEPTKLLIPQSTKGYPKFHVATLQAEAPFFKILAVENGMVKEKKNKSVTIPPKSEVINLPGGKKLVTANPLAHLLGNKPIDELMNKPRKRYSPVIKDFQGMLANAMRKLDDGPPPKKPKVKG